MESSGKWGDNREAVALLKTAFYIALAQILNEQFSRAIPYQDYLIVVLVNYFRLLFIFKYFFYVIFNFFLSFC